VSFRPLIEEDQTYGNVTTSKESNQWLSIKNHRRSPLPAHTRRPGAITRIWLIDHSLVSTAAPCYHKLAGSRLQLDPALIRANRFYSYPL
jgi:hypothetical protein